MLSDFLVRSVLVVLPALGLVSGFAISLLGLPAWQGWVWAAFTVPVLLALLYEIVASLRRGEVGLDIVAALSMTAALAVGENLAAVVVEARPRERYQMPNSHRGFSLRNISPTYCFMTS